MLHQRTLDYAKSRSFELSPYQAEDACRLADQGTHFLFLDTGLGKTIVALAAIAELQDRCVNPTGKAQKLPFPVLVICPKIAVDMWEQTILRFFPGAVTDLARTGKHFFNESGQFFIVPESLMTKPQIKDQLWALGGHTLIIDESHYFKTPSTARTKALYGEDLTGENGYVEHAARTWLLSGTPMPNGLPGELYPALACLDPARLYTGQRERKKSVMGHWRFRQLFHTMRRKTIGRRTVWQDTGARNIETFNHLLSIEPQLVTRRRIEDYLDLKEPLVTQYPITGTELRLPAELLERVTDDEGNMHFPETVEEIQALFGEEELSRMVRIIGQCKAPAVAELVGMRHGGGDRRILVGFWHRNVGDTIHNRLQEAGIAAAVIDGSTPQKERMQIIDSFQSVGGRPVLLGQISALGISINLQACHRVIMAEASWVPGSNKQFIARCHRRGQLNRVLVDWTFLVGSIDQAIQAAIHRKLAQVEEVFEGITA